MTEKRLQQSLGGGVPADTVPDTCATTVTFSAASFSSISEISRFPVMKRCHVVKI